jgi:hypothetical protein
MIRILPSWRYEDGINFCPLFYLKKRVGKGSRFLSKRAASQNFAMHCICDISCGMADSEIVIPSGFIIAGVIRQ